MNKYKRIIIFVMIKLIFLSIVPYKSSSAKVSMGLNFTNIGVEDGLSQGTVEAIMQDKDGYIWIGTADGLNRYNGFDFKIYKSTRENENSIINNYINFIKEDSKGNKWIGTVSGLSKIDTYGNIKNYSSEILGGGELSHYNICDVLITLKGEVLIATPTGISIYNSQKDSFESIYDEVVKGEYIFTIDEDEYGQIWIGTDNKIYKLSIDVEDIKKVRSVETYADGKEIYKIVCDKKGYVWAGTTEEGLVKIDLSNGEETVYKNDLNDKQSLPSNYVKIILRDSNDIVWIGTSNGLARYNEEKDNFIVYRSNGEDRKSLINDDVHSLMEDRSGLIWVGTYSGISIFNPKSKFTHYKYDANETDSISESSATAVYEDTGFLWVGSRTKGLSIIDRKNETVEKLVEGNKDTDLSNNRVNTIVGDENYIWIGTQHGLNRYDKKTKKIKKYFDEYNLPSLAIRALYLDGKNLIIGTTKGVAILDTEKDKMVDITEALKENGLIDTFMNSVYVDKDGIIWIGTFFEGGLMSVDLKNNIYKNYRYDKSENSISSNCINHIVEDDENNLWIATSYGLNKLNKKEEKFTWYTESDGLANNYVYSIVIDDEENIWTSTNCGISKIDKDTNLVSNFTTDDGLQHNEFNSNAFGKTKDGKIIFGGINGVNIFNPKEVNQVPLKISTIIDSVSINGIEYKSVDGKSLKYNENRIGVKFFLPDYRNVKNIKYFCMLEGVEDEWKLVESNEITYTNLKPGTYKFKVMARNHSGILTDETTFSFKIKPPFWKSKGFILLIVMIVMIWFISNKMKMKLLDKKVLEKTKELSEEMEKSKSLYKKIIELERNKNNYFVNLSHELRTPLNVIMSTQQLMNNLNKGEGILPDKLDFYIEIMRKNTVRLLNLINNIIDTSKIESGAYKISVKDNDIVYLVEEATLSLKEYIEEKGIELIIDPKIEEKIIECDGEEIERCIINIVSNAAKFTPDGGKIEVEIVEVDDKIYISISDTGIGIDKKFHSKIFDRFNQVDEFNNENKGGSGLGLTITKHIVELHHGEIRLESKKNKGSKFTIILPVKQL